MANSFSAGRLPALALLLHGSALLATNDLMPVALPAFGSAPASPAGGAVDYDGLALLFEASAGEGEDPDKENLPPAPLTVLAREALAPATVSRLSGGCVVRNLGASPLTLTLVACLENQGAEVLVNGDEGQAWLSLGGQRFVDVARRWQVYLATRVPLGSPMPCRIFEGTNERGHVGYLLVRFHCDPPAQSWLAAPWRKAPVRGPRR